MLQHIIFAADQYTFHKACITAMLLINGTNSLHDGTNPLQSVTATHNTRHITRA